MADALGYALKLIIQVLKPELESLFDSTPNEFDSLQDIYNLYEGGIQLPEGILKDIRENIPAEMIKEIFRTDGERFLKFPTPQVIQGINIIHDHCSLFVSCELFLFNFDILDDLEQRISLHGGLMRNLQERC